MPPPRIQLLLMYKTWSVRPTWSRSAERVSFCLVPVGPTPAQARALAVARDQPAFHDFKSKMVCCSDGILIPPTEGKVAPHRKLAPYHHFKAEKNAMLFCGSRFNGESMDGKIQNLDGIQHEKTIRNICIKFKKNWQRRVQTHINFEVFERFFTMSVRSL